MINPNISLFKLFVILLALSYLIAIFVKAKLSAFKVIFSLVMLFLGVTAVRNISLFGLWVLPIITENLYLAGVAILSKHKNQEKVSIKKEFALLVIFFSVFAGVFIYLVDDLKGQQSFMKYPLGLGLKPGVEDSVNFFHEKGLKGPIFNNYDNGSALIFWLYPKEKIFVDNRPEAYSIDFFNQIFKPMMDDNKTWDSLSEKYGINTVIVSHADGTPWARKFISNMLSNESWPMVYLDQDTLISLKNNDQNKQIIDKYAYDKNKFEKRLHELFSSSDEIDVKLSMADLADLSGSYSMSIHLVEKILEKKPDNARALATMGYYMLRSPDSGAPMRSIAYFEKAIEKGYKLPSIYVQMGLVYYSLQEIDQAKAMWNKALGLDKNNQSALDYLKQLKEAGI
jgi:hypothetical protein